MAGNFSMIGVQEHQSEPNSCSITFASALVIVLAYLLSVATMAAANKLADLGHKLLSTGLIVAFLATGSAFGYGCYSFFVERPAYLKAQAATKEAAEAAAAVSGSASPTAGAASPDSTAPKLQ